MEGADDSVPWWAIGATVAAVGTVVVANALVGGGGGGASGSRVTSMSGQLQTDAELVELAKNAWYQLRLERPDLDEVVAVLRDKGGWTGVKIRKLDATELPPGFLWRGRAAEEGRFAGGLWPVDVRAEAARLLDRLETQGVVPGVPVKVKDGHRVLGLLLGAEGFVEDRFGRWASPARPDYRVVPKGRTLREEKRTEDGRWVSTNYLTVGTGIGSWVEKRLQTLSNRALRVDAGEKARDVRGKRRATAARAKAAAGDKPIRQRAIDTVGKRQMRAIIDAGLAERIATGGGDPRVEPALDAQIRAIAAPLEAGVEPEIERLKGIVAREGRLPVVDDGALFSVDVPPWPWRMGPALYRWDELGGSPEATTVTIERIDRQGHLDVRIGAAPAGGILGLDLSSLQVKQGRPDVDADRHGRGTLFARILPPGTMQAQTATAAAATGAGRTVRPGPRLRPRDPPVALLTHLVGLDEETDPSSGRLTDVLSPVGVRDGTRLLELLLRLLRAWKIPYLLVDLSVWSGRLSRAPFNALAKRDELRSATPDDQQRASVAFNARILGVEPWLPRSQVILVVAAA